MTEPQWIIIEHVDPETAEFPLTTQVDGEDVVVFRVGEHLRAIQRQCPHQDADLAAGTLMGSMIKCPRHGFIFSLSDGKGKNCPGINAKVFEVSIEDGKIRVRKNAGS